MPLPLIPLLILTSILVGGALALTFWGQIASLMTQTVLPWLRENVPSIAGFAETVFGWLDKITVAAVQKSRQYWKSVRQWLVNQLVTFEQSENIIVQRVCTTFRKLLEPGKAEETTHHVETKVKWLDAPSEVRNHFIKTNKPYVVDTTDLVDRRIENPEQEIIISQEI